MNNNRKQQQIQRKREKYIYIAGSQKYDKQICRDERHCQIFSSKTRLKRFILVEFFFCGDKIFNQFLFKCGAQQICICGAQVSSRLRLNSIQSNENWTADKEKKICVISIISIISSKCQTQKLNILTARIQCALYDLTRQTPYFFWMDCCNRPAIEMEKF